MWDFSDRVSGSVSVKTTVCDSREPKEIVKLGRQYIKNLEVEFLPIGDVVSGEVCFERKTIRDFANSVKNGRIFRQAEHMTANFEYPYIIIVGNINELQYDRYIHFSENQYLGAMGSLTASGVPCLTVNTEKDLWILIKKIVSKKGGKGYNYSTKKRTKNDDVYVNALTGIQGIGPEKAKAILKDFPWPKLVKATEKDLCSVKGIGKVQAKRIKKWF